MEFIVILLIFIVGLVIKRFFYWHLLWLYGLLFLLGIGYGTVVMLTVTIPDVLKKGDIKGGLFVFFGFVIPATILGVQLIVDWRTWRNIRNWLKESGIHKEFSELNDAERLEYSNWLKQR